MSADLDKAASVLYDRTPTSDGPTPTADDVLLTGGAPESRREIPVLDKAADTLYSRTSGLETLDLEPLAEASGVSYADRAAFSAQTKETLADMRLGPVNARMVAGAINAGLRRPPDAKQQGAMERACVENAKTRFGDKWQEELKHTQAYLSRFPGMRTLLERSGAGSDPRVVEAVMDAARRARIGK